MHRIRHAQSVTCLSAAVNTMLPSGQQIIDQYVNRILTYTPLELDRRQRSRTVGGRFSMAKKKKSKKGKKKK